MGQAVKRVPSTVEAAGEAVLIRTLLSRESCQYYSRQLNSPEGKSTGEENEINVPCANCTAQCHFQWHHGSCHSGACSYAGGIPALCLHSSLSYNPWREGEGNKPVFSSKRQAIDRFAVVRWLKRKQNMEDQARVRLKPSNLCIAAQFGTNKESGVCDDSNSIATQIKWDVAESGAKSDDHPKRKKTIRNNKREYGQADEEGDSQTAGTSVGMDEAGRGSSRQDKTRQDSG